MTKIDYQGWELEYFDNSKNFRNYQNDLIKNYIRGYTAEIGPGNGENLKLYLDRVEKVDLFEPSKILFENLKSKYQDNQNLFLKNASTCVYTHMFTYTYRRRKIYCIELILHTPCIPVSMLALDLTAGGVMNIHVEDGVLERAQH